MTTKRKGRRPKIEWKFERVDAGPMSEEDFDFVCQMIARWIYDAEMKKRQTQVIGNVDTPSRNLDPTRDESTFLLSLS